jgi:hypothetical protein
MSSFEHPISLSDEQLNVITPLAEPLAPPDRSAFLASLANLLRHEPQPLGDGVVFRSARQLFVDWALQAQLDSRDRHHAPAP